MLEGASIIVRARFAPLHEEDGYQFRKDEMGVVQWQRHEKEITFWMPLVTWDEDPEKKPREVLTEYLEVIGLETPGCRFQIGQVSGLAKTR